MSTTLPALPSAFADLGLVPELLASLSALGYEEPTPVQREAIPPLLEGRDLLGQAATGTGKTAAFALPILQRWTEERTAGGRPFALVLVPTRELAMQVAEAVHRYGKDLGVRVRRPRDGDPRGPGRRGAAQRRAHRALRASRDATATSDGDPRRRLPVAARPSHEPEIVEKRRSSREQNPSPSPGISSPRRTLRP